MEHLSNSNPLMITFTNITIVFAVLYCMGWVIKFIHYIDPTRKKDEVKTAPPAAAPPAPAPAAAPAQSPLQQDDAEIVAVIAAAVAAYGIKASQIVSIRPVGGQAWSQAGRFEALNARSQMF